MPGDDKKFNIPTRNVDFQVDTIPNNKYHNGAYYYSRNAIELSYRDGETRINTLQHEQKHKDNQEAGLYDYDLSFEQTYKIHMHDEISANMASLIALRQKYIETGDISVLDYSDDRYAFYKDAIKRGVINPHSEYKEDFDKEMALIANGTRDKWEENYADLYSKTHEIMSLYALKNEEGKICDQNYQKALKIAYTIGGVDFTQYMDRDVDISSSVKETSDALTILGRDCLVEIYNKAGVSLINDYSEAAKKIGKNKTEYRKWEDKDGSRVSEVQYKEILDLTKDVIKKPTKSYSESMQKGHAKIAEMRAKRAAGHEEISSSTRDESPMAARLRELRFENAQRSSGSVTPTRINAMHLANLLEGSVNHYG